MKNTNTSYLLIHWKKKIKMTSIGQTFGNRVPNEFQCESHFILSGFHPSEIKGINHKEK